ncbi:hypothetical protein FPQ18DRAFT_386576 [Pyronema domesticum]|nr:hypothetical protein FPQ18DRAFT_386576 [Pyronema domesticum]
MKDNNDINFYLKPSPDTYDTGRFFYMPTRNGPVWAIAFDIEYVVMIMAAYNVLIGLIFLIVDMIRAPPEPSPFRGNITEDDRAPFASAGFVLATRDVSTLSATVLIAVPSVLLLLSFILLSLEVKMRLAVTKDSSDESSHKGRPLKDTLISRLRYLEATQLYRFLKDSNCKQVDYDLQWRPVLNKPELELRTPYYLGTSHPGLLPLSDIDDNNERSENKTGFGYTQLEKTASENALSMDMVSNTIPEDERPLIETLIRIKMQNRAFNSV